MILGTISSVDSIVGLQVTIDGESSASTKKYSYLASYVPAAGDRVIIEEISGSYVIMGKLVTEVAQSGIVRQATNATTAASCSGNAATATVAASCSGNAATATSAAKCTGNAATATTAAACSGNAATATVSNATKGFDATFTNTETGQLVTRIDREYNSTLGKYIVTDVATSFSRSFAYK